MTFNELSEKLKEIGVEEFESEAKIIAEEISNTPFKKILLDKNISLENEEEINIALKKRKQNIPIQYIVGKTYFYNQEYIVNDSVLIPRQDTELIVEKAIELMPKGARFLDLCTGSGCIAISIASEREDVVGLAVDKFKKTLDVAIENADLNKVYDRVDFMIWDILDGETVSGIGEFDVIVSNPPYIKKDVLKTLSNEVKHEPICALDGGIDGMCFYRKIVSEHSVLLKPNGIIIFEIGFDQGEDIKLIARENGFNCEIIKDYSSNDRVAILKR